MLYTQNCEVSPERLTQGWTPLTATMSSRPLGWSHKWYWQLAHSAVARGTSSGRRSDQWSVCGWVHPALPPSEISFLDTNTEEVSFESPNSCCSSRTPVPRILWPQQDLRSSIPTIFPFMLTKYKLCDQLLKSLPVSSFFIVFIWQAPPPLLNLTFCLFCAAPACQIEHNNAEWAHVTFMIMSLHWAVNGLWHSYYISWGQWLSTGGNFNHRVHLAMARDTLGCHKQGARGKEATVMQWVEARDAQNILQCTQVTLLRQRII